MIAEAGTQNDLSLCIFPPNKPLEAVLDFSKKPVLYDNLLFVDFNDKGECILGSSNIDSTFWEGTLLFYKNPEKLLTNDHDAHYIFATASDGKFINNTTIALAEETGVLTILSLVDGLLQPIKFFRHCQNIPEIATWKNAPKILTCCDKSVFVWDIDTLERKPYYKFDNFHLSLINSVDVLQNDVNQFLTASNDRKAVIWDTRSDKPAQVLYSNEFSAIKNIKWNQTNTNYIIAGTQAGDVYLLDKREPKDFVAVKHCYESSIHRIAIENNKVAVCGNSTEIITYDCNNATFNSEHRISTHNKFVRSVKWVDNVLYSCGFDKKVIKHDV
ncbi:unnamed protein product [Brassicogethes aeneus]|uniref:Uncharacterized protein n=1 Tax=Brassicogethes aeneus TaxID=1431903 RepID=A0A9P0APC7_BRAAE|nr:unnamed protein product [Brassicogethes aeneus]